LTGRRGGWSPRSVPGLASQREADNGSPAGNVGSRRVCSRHAKNLFPTPPTIACGPDAYFTDRHAPLSPEQNHFLAANCHFRPDGRHRNLHQSFKRNRRTRHAADSFHCNFKLAGMPFVASPLGASGLSIARQPEPPKIIHPPNLAFAEHFILLFRDRPVAVGQIRP
jgi:hypothetical protein